MTRLGLTVNEAKTSLKNARQERFDFLGYSLGPHRHKADGLEREFVQEERATVQDEGRQSAWQQQSAARSARHAEQVSNWLVDRNTRPISIQSSRPSAN
jgi:hypothetical protein